VTRARHPRPTTSDLSVSQSNPNPGPAPTPTPLDSLLANVLTQLDAIEASLDLDIVVRPNDVHQMRAVARVTDTALLLASDVVSSAPDQFPQFAGLPAATNYVRSMGKLALRASELAAHVQKSVSNQRTPAAIQTLTLYGVVKSLGRIPNSEAMREKVAALKSEVAPKRHLKKPRVTKGEKVARRVAAAKAKKLEKARLLLASEDTTSTPAPAAVTPSDATVSPPVVAKPAAPSAPSLGGALPALNAAPVNGASGAAAN
jgi:hypothetical protein